jgi:hypothetical protein
MHHRHLSDAVFHNSGSRQGANRHRDMKETKASFSFCSYVSDSVAAVLPYKIRMFTQQIAVHTSSAFTRHNASAYNVESSRTFLVSVAPTTGE